MPRLPWCATCSLCLSRPRAPRFRRASSMSDRWRGMVVEPLSAVSYACSRAAIHHLSKVLAAELAPHRITVNTLVPGYFSTSMTSYIRAEEERLSKLMARVRLGTAEDAVGACLILSSRAGVYMTSCELVIDGGMTRCR